MRFCSSSWGRRWSCSRRLTLSRLWVIIGLRRGPFRNGGRVRIVCRGRHLLCWMLVIGISMWSLGMLLSPLWTGSLDSQRLPTTKLNSVPSSTWLSVTGSPKTSISSRMLNSTGDLTSKKSKPRMNTVPGHPGPKRTVRCMLRIPHRPILCKRFWCSRIKRRQLSKRMITWMRWGGAERSQSGQRAASQTTIARWVWSGRRIRRRQRLMIFSRAIQPRKKSATRSSNCITKPPSSKVTRTKPNIATAPTLRNAWAAQEPVARRQLRLPNSCSRETVAAKSTTVDRPGSRPSKDTSSNRTWPRNP